METGTKTIRCVVSERDRLFFRTELAQSEDGAEDLSGAQLERSCSSRSKFTSSLTCAGVSVPRSVDLILLTYNLHVGRNVREN